MGSLPTPVPRCHCKGRVPPMSAPMRKPPKAGHRNLPCHSRRLLVAGAGTRQVNPYEREQQQAVLRAARTRTPPTGEGGGVVGRAPDEARHRPRPQIRPASQTRIRTQTRRCDGGRLATHWSAGWRHGPLMRDSDPSPSQRSRVRVNE